MDVLGTCSPGKYGDFPAWKKTVRPEQHNEMAERFEEVEHWQFGAGGFDEAVQWIACVEQTVGIADLATFTAPSPPSGMIFDRDAA